MKSNPEIFLLMSHLAGVLVLATAGCKGESQAWDTAAGVLVSPVADAGVTDAIKAVEAAIPTRVMQGSGLAGAMGGVNLKAQRAGSYDVLLPLPQFVDSQVPVFYCLNAKPKEALSACRLQVRNDGNVFVSLKLEARKNEEVAVEWCSVILIAPGVINQDAVAPEAFREASPCAQAGSPPIVKLAGELWPPTGTTKDYAASIQQSISRMQPRKQPRSLDAVGILESGQNTICTANANLACALMRARQIPCRSIATLPTIARRFEMHRVAEYYDHGAWTAFDPSLVNADIPLKPWQNIIMSKTELADEQASMAPRLGSMRGCPFGQEVEFAQAGLNLSGQAFFWTIAVPLAEFEVPAEAARLTADHWEHYLKTGTMSEAQIKAASARKLDDYLHSINIK